MKKQKFKFLSALLAILMVLTLLLNACEEKPNNQTTPENDATGTTTIGNADSNEQQNIDSVETIEVLSTFFTASVVIPQGSTEELQDKAETLQKGLNRYGTIAGKIKNDSAPYNSATVEILLGLTDYDESETLAVETQLGSWAVKVVGNKIVIYSHLMEGYSKAVTSLVAYIRNHSANGKLEIPVNLRLEGVIVSLLNEIPLPESKIFPTKFMSEDPENQSYFVYFPQATAENYNLYKQQLIRKGYALYSEKILADNVYRTFTAQDYYIHTQYTPCDQAMRVEIERSSYSNLPALTNSYVPSATAQEILLTEVGLYYTPDTVAGETWDSYINGLCITTRLGDGSFIIVDGGHDLDRNVELLYNTLAKQAPDPNHIVVAAWIFTHGHADHIGTFRKMVNDHKDIAAKFEIEQFIYSFPNPSNGPKAGAYNTAILNDMRTYQNAKFTMARPGQVFYLREAELTIWYTPDLYYPNEITWFNDTSVQFTIDVAGVRTRYTGDSGEVSSAYMVDFYGTCPDQAYQDAQ